MVLRARCFRDQSRVSDVIVDVRSVLSTADPSVNRDGSELEAFRL
jgi:hypothetical protein